MNCGDKYIITIESGVMMEILVFQYVFDVHAFPIIKLWQDFSSLILLCSFLYDDCTLSTYTQVDKE